MVQDEAQAQHLMAAVEAAIQAAVSSNLAGQGKSMYHSPENLIHKCYNTEQGQPVIA